MQAGAWCPTFVSRPRLSTACQSGGWCRCRSLGSKKKGILWFGFEHHFAVDSLVWATVAIAAGTFVLALGTVYLAWSTRKGVRLQEREFGAAQAAARPQLEVDVGFNKPGGAIVAFGQVRYIHGSEPAYDAEVWIKTRTQSFGGRMGVILTPSEPARQFEFDGIPDDMFKRWPFPEAHKAPVLDGDEFWAGLTWRSPDGTPGTRRYKQLRDGTRDEHPEVMEPFPRLERDR